MPNPEWERGPATLHVRLLGQSVEVWRPVSAQHIGGNRFRLLGEMPETEVWEFSPGDIVYGATQVLSEGRVLVAEALAPTHDMTGSVFIRRLGGPPWDSPGVEPRTYLFEIEPDGYFPRQVILDPFNVPVFVTQPEQYPIGDFPAPPGSREFEEQFGSGHRISREEFAAIYDRAVVHLGREPAYDDQVLRRRDDVK